MPINSGTTIQSVFNGAYPAVLPCAALLDALRDGSGFKQGPLYRPETRLRTPGSNRMSRKKVMSVFYRSLLVAALIAAAVHAFTMGVLCDVLPREATPPMFHATRSLRFEQGNFLRLAHTDGSVEVFTHEGSEFLLSADIRAYGPKEYLDATHAYVDTMVQGSTDGGGIRIHTETGERPEPVDIRIDYQLTVPRGANVSVEGANGNVLVHEGCGALFVQGNNTDIKIVSPGAAVRAQSNNGRIQVLNAPSETVLKTINGNIYASMEGGYLEADTTNGSVSVLLRSGEVSSCNLTSLNGGITLALVDPDAVAVDARTDNGLVHCGLALAYADGFPKRRKVVGTAGTGTSKVSLYSRNGDISIARSPS